MDETIDRPLIAGAFAVAAREGWGAVTVAAAAREGGVALDAARLRCPTRETILLRLGRELDAAALADATEEGTPRERLFDLLIRRFDAMQPYRAGLSALFRSLPARPGTALLLGAATTVSMAWMLEAAGIPTAGLAGALRVQGLVAVWVSTARTWERDTSPDLSATMAALDRALDRAERLAPWLDANGGRGKPGGDEAAVAPKPFPDVPEPGTPAPEQAA